MQLKVETRTPQEGVAVIGLEGEVDVYTSPRLKQEMVDLLNRGLVNLVVDLNAVKYLDSTGLGVLIGGLKRESVAFVNRESLKAQKDLAAEGAKKDEIKKRMEAFKPGLEGYKEALEKLEA